MGLMQVKTGRVCQKDGDSSCEYCMLLTVLCNSSDGDIQSFLSDRLLEGKTPRFPAGAFAYLDEHPWLQAARRSNDLPPA